MVKRFDNKFLLSCLMSIVVQNFNSTASAVLIYFARVCSESYDVQLPLLAVNKLSCNIKVFG
jgi:hypothetical protein